MSDFIGQSVHRALMEHGSSGLVELCPWDKLGENSKSAARSIGAALTNTKLIDAAYEAGFEAGREDVIGRLSVALRASATAPVAAQEVRLHVPSGDDDLLDTGAPPQRFNRDMEDDNGE